VSSTDRRGIHPESQGIWRYGVAILAVAAALGIRLALDPELGQRGVFLLFALAIGVAGLFGGGRPGLTATVLSVLAAWYALTEERFSFVITDKTEIFSLALLGIVGISISFLAGQTRWALLMARKSAEEAKQNESRARALAAQLLTAQEEERRRVSRELHDGICQDLASLIFDTAGMAAEFSPGDPYWTRLRSLQVRLAELSNETRNVAYRLHASVLDDLGLVVALQALCDEFPRQEDITIEFLSEPVEGELPQTIASCFYRVAQEALQNIRKYAKATHVVMTLSAANGKLVLLVEDDGAGFDVNAVKGRGTLGLLSMEERALMVGGTFAIESRPGKGTRVTLTVPFAAGSATDVHAAAGSPTATL
jgi:signal transduction histidine kinase